MKCKHVYPAHWTEWEQYGEYKTCTKCGHMKWAPWVIQAAKQKKAEATKCFHKCPVHCLPKK